METSKIIRLSDEEIDKIGSKLIIIETLKSSINKYISSNNYYVKASNYSSSDDNIMNVETYNKNDIQLVKYTYLNESNPAEIIEYHNGNTTNSYINVGGEKTARLNYGAPKTSMVSKDVYTENFYGDLLMAMFSSITSEECNGKQCYKIIKPEDVASEFPDVLYVEKDTGLPIKEINYILVNYVESYMSTNYEYKFNTIIDEDVKEPDINEYKVQ